MIERIIVGIFRTNCYLFALNKKECIIIDPGGDAEKIISQIELLNMVPTGIVFTHGHFDHTMASGAIIDYFKNKGLQIKCAIHHEDREYLGKTYNTKLTVIETPAHTKGSISLYSEQDAVLFTGDTLFFDGIGRSDLPGGDAKLLIASIKEKLLVLPPETSVFPGHGPLTTIERELKGNSFLI
jgi:hydroxyacylglutathione hydrolase